MLPVIIAAISLITMIIAAFGVVVFSGVLRRRRPKAERRPARKKKELESTLQTIELADTEPDKTFIVHHKGPCPDGWLFVPELFTEGSGAKESGCVRPARTDSQTREVQIDYLKGGEGVEFPIRFRVEQ